MTTSVAHVDLDGGDQLLNGVVNSTWLLAAAQAALGFEVTVFVHVPLTDPVRDHARAAGVSLVRSSRSLTRGSAGWVDDALGYDLVHFHSAFIPAHSRVSRRLDRLGKPYVVTPHGGLTRASLGRHAGRKKAYLLLAERRHVGRAGLVVAVGDDEAGELRDRFPSARVERWYNPIDVDATSAGSWAGGASGPIVSIGRFDIHQKGLDRLARMARLVPDARFHVYGDGTPEQRRAVEELFGDLPNVEVFGPVFGAEKTAVLVAASRLVLTSRWEGFPVVAAEALHLGTPWLATRASGLAPLQGEGLGGLLPDDATAAAETLVTSLAGQDQAHVASAAGTAWAREHLDPQRIAAGLGESYRSLLDRRALPPVHGG